MSRKNQQRYNRSRRFRFHRLWSFAYLLWKHHSTKFLLRCFKKFKIKERPIIKKLLQFFCIHFLWKWFPWKCKNLNLTFNLRLDLRSDLRLNLWFDLSGSTSCSTTGSNSGSSFDSTSGSTSGSTSDSTSGSTTDSTSGSTSGLTSDSTSGSTTDSTWGSTWGSTVDAECALLTECSHRWTSGRFCHQYNFINYQIWKCK